MKKYFNLLSILLITSCIEISAQGRELATFRQMLLQCALLKSMINVQPVSTSSPQLQIYDNESCCTLFPVEPRFTKEFIKLIKECAAEYPWLEGKSTGPVECNVDSEFVACVVVTK